MERSLILYDGVCGLCDHFVRFVLRGDGNAVFFFAALQSDLALRALSRHALRPESPDTVVLVEDFEGPRERVFLESEAVLRVCARLRPPWPALAALRFLPRPVRDAAYRFVARHRYRVFGRFESCPLPARETRARFLDLRSNRAAPLSPEPAPDSGTAPAGEVPPAGR